MSEHPGSLLDEARLRRLMEVGRSLMSDLDLDTILEGVLDAARELTGAQYAALGVVDQQGANLERFLTAGISEDIRHQIGELPRGRGLLGLLIVRPEPLRLDDLGAHPESYGFPGGHPPMTTFLGVPIMLRGEPFGNLYLTEKTDGPFDAADEEAACVLADWASLAISHSRLYAGADRRRRELERTVDALKAASELAEILSEESDLGRVLELLAKRTRSIVDAATVLILLDEEDQLRVAATAGSPADRAATIATSEQIRQALGGPIRLEDGESVTLAVPMRRRSHAAGVLVAIYDGAPDGSNEEAEALLSSLAANGAVAVARTLA